MLDFKTQTFYVKKIIIKTKVFTLHRKLLVENEQKSKEIEIKQQN